MEQSAIANRKRGIDELKVKLFQAYQDNSLGDKSEVLTDNDWEIYSQLQIDDAITQHNSDDGGEHGLETSPQTHENELAQITGGAS